MSITRVPASAIRFGLSQRTDFEMVGRLIWFAFFSIPFCAPLRKIIKQTPNAMMRHPTKTIRLSPLEGPCDSSGAATLTRVRHIKAVGGAPSLALVGRRPTAPLDPAPTGTAEDEHPRINLLGSGSDRDDPQDAHEDPR